jgi:hydroxypyruvate isomerase
MKMCANLSLLFTELPLLERIVAAAAAGFAGVEIQFPYAIPAIRLQEALTQAGMPLVLMNFPAAEVLEGGAGLAAVPGRQAQFAEALRLALSYAALLRPRAVNVLSGRLAPGVARAQAIAVLETNLRQAAEAFQCLGIGVLSEALNPLDMPGFLIHSDEQLNELVERVDHANFRAQLDLYHMARQGIDPVLAVKSLAGRIGHVQFADCPGRGQPGSGQVDFARVLQALWSSGYRGWLGAE